VMALARFAKEHRFNAAAGAKRLFDEADAFDTNGSGFCWETAAEGHAELFEPAIVPARKDSGKGCSRAGSIAGGFAGGGH